MDRIPLSLTAGQPLNPDAATDASPSAAQFHQDRAHAGPRPVGLRWLADAHGRIVADVRQGDQHLAQAQVRATADVRRRPGRRARPAARAAGAASPGPCCPWPPRNARTRFVGRPQQQLAQGAALDDLAAVDQHDVARPAGPPRRCRASPAPPLSAAGRAGAGIRPGCASRVPGSRAPNGSSMSSRSGSAARARATPTRCRWPPDSSRRHAPAELRLGQADQVEHLADAPPHPLARPAEQARHRGHVRRHVAGAETGRPPG